MKVARWVAVGVVIGIGLAAVVLGADSAGDIKRYVRMRSM
jgi:hypothetical protein